MPGRRLIVGVAALGITCATMAQPAAAEFGRTTEGVYQCQSPPGRYEREDITALVPTAPLTGYFRFLEGTHDRSYAPTAGFLVDYGNGGAVEVHVTALRRRLLVEVRAPRATRSQLIAREPQDGEVAVMLSFLPNGVLDVASSGRSARIEVGASRPPVMQLTCQSGRFEIDLRPRTSVAPR